MTTTAFPAKKCDPGKGSLTEAAGAYRHETIFQFEQNIASRVALGQGRRLDVYLIDGTYELFRHYYALPSAHDQDGRETAAVRGVLASVLGMIHGGARYVGVATDHVIESFRNRLWPGYKTSEGVEPDLLAQFPL